MHRRQFVAQHVQQRLQEGDGHGTDEKADRAEDLHAANTLNRASSGCSFERPWSTSGLTMLSTVETTTRDRHHHGRRRAIFIEIEPEAGGYPNDRRADKRHHRQDGQDGEEKNGAEAGEIKGDSRQIPWMIADRSVATTTARLTLMNWSTSCSEYRRSKGRSCTSDWIIAGPLARKSVQGEDHHQQPEEKVADELRRSQGHGGEPLLHAADNGLLQVLDGQVEFISLLHQSTAG